MALQSDGKILLSGGFDILIGKAHLGIGRLNNPDPAFQKLAFEGSTITWLRGGSSPEVWQTTFDFSTNRSDWISLGTGTRIPGGWQLPGVFLPTNAVIRARGFVHGDSSWSVETTLAVVPNAPPTIHADRNSFGATSNHFGLNVTGLAGQNVILEASTNLLNWSSLSTNTLEDSPLLFIDDQSPLFTNRFYRVLLK